MELRATEDDPFNGVVGRETLQPGEGISAWLLRLLQKIQLLVQLALFHRGGVDDPRLQCTSTVFANHHHAPGGMVNRFLGALPCIPK